MTEKIIPVIFLKDNKAYKDIACKAGFDKSPVEIATDYSDNGADEILLYDLSYDDASHEANIGMVRKIANTIDVPLLVGGNVARTEDVKKYLYAGAKCAFLLAGKESNVALIKEVSDRFGKQKILLFADIFDKEALLTALTSQIAGIIVPDEETESDVNDFFAANTSENALDKAVSDSEGSETPSVIKPYYDCIFDIMNLKAELKALGKDVNMFESSISFDSFKLNSDGLIPVIVQDYKTDEVLMLAYMNEEAFNLTVSTGKMTYFSRSRQEIWVKGLTSGHFQYVMSMEIDCDSDTLLAKVRQVGAACHTGNRSCFYTNLFAREYANTNPLKVFNEVMGTILDRKEHPKEGSYTNYLFDKGIDKILKKVGEEATEIVIAAKNPDKEEIKYEVADFLYHVMVLMALKGVTWDEIITELARR